ncbi:uncharacterized protein LOC110686745 [Chenopodium quinoa]|uniref:uncharacterized protein LOC110686745 n=1 Tax=Chenopodium quinoa TaxID=63459 RepID=UPI000B774252|nr:uncharacterized protein LOC110686745 [Chenopodium quinoa]
MKVWGSQSEYVEAMTELYALRLARRMGYKNIWVECDAVNVVNQVNASTRGLSPLFVIYDDIKIDRAWFDSCIVTHVKRSCNTVSHLVARWDTMKELGCGLEVQLVVQRGERDIKLHEVIRVLEEKGAEVVNATFSTSGNNVFHTLHARARSSRIGVETSRVQERLQELT